MRSAVFAAVLVFTMILPNTSLGKTIYVDNQAGDDQFNGLSPSTGPEAGAGPVRTIARALRLAMSGDVIHLANNEEPYREPIALVGRRLSGDAFSFFTIEGNGATIDGSQRVPESAWEIYDRSVFRFRPRFVSHQQLFLDGRPAERVFVDPRSERPAELEPLQWCLLGGYVYFRVERFRLPYDYDLQFSAERSGVTLMHVDRVVIRDLIVQGFQLDGIHAFNSAREILLDGVTCRGNGRAGVVVGPCSDVTLNACLLGDNGDTQIIARGLSRAWIERSALLTPFGTAWRNEGGEIWIDGMPAGAAP